MSNSKKGDRVHNDSKKSELTPEIEVVAVYFVNKYWNNIYELARGAWQEGKFSGLFESYKSYCYHYVDLIAAHDPSQINEMFEYYKKYITDVSTHTEFVASLATCMLPRGVDTSKSERIIFGILSKAMIRFTQWCLEQNTSLQVGSRENKNEMLRWKLTIYDYIYQEIKAFCSHVVAKQTGTNVTSKQGLDSRSIDIIQTKLKTLIDEKHALMSQLSAVNEKNDELLKTIATLKAENNDLKMKMLMPDSRVQAVQPRMPDSQPRAMIAQPRMSDSQPRATIAQPRMSDPQPTQVDSQPEEPDSEIDFADDILEAELMDTIDVPESPPPKQEPVRGRRLVKK